MWAGAGSGFIILSLFNPNKDTLYPELCKQILPFDDLVVLQPVKADELRSQAADKCFGRNSCDGVFVIRPAEPFFFLLGRHLVLGYNITS